MPLVPRDLWPGVFATPWKFRPYKQIKNIPNNFLGPCTNFAGLLGAKHDFGATDKQNL